MSDKKYAAIHYQKYLQLDKILNAQKLRSSELESPAHDEMLFIIIHQAYELWFKQIIHEVGAVMEDLSEDVVDEKSIGRSVYKLDRVVEIQKLLIKQVDIIETMSPLNFLDFRDYLFPASGFQSFQFRKLEVLLGLEDDERILYNEKPYYMAFQPREREKIKKLRNEMSLKEHVQNWLERTPFLQFEEFSFIDAYKESLEKMLTSEKEKIKNSTYLDDEQKEMRLQMLGDTHTYYKTVLDKEYHQKQLEEGNLTFSYDATIAALFIRLYRDEPILHEPNEFLNRLVDMDEYLISWRFRHSQMVQRMLGNKMGTGGSSGHKYLRKTADQHHIFRDLHNISTLMMPSSFIPDLPENVKKALGYHYSYIKAKS